MNFQLIAFITFTQPWNFEITFGDDGLQADDFGNKIGYSLTMRAVGKIEMI